MWTRSSLLLAAALAHLVPGARAQAETRKPPIIACIGDADTFGTELGSTDRSTWPTLLQAMLGSEAHVEAYGVDGASLATGTARSFIASDIWQSVLASEASAVIVMLGSEDARAQDPGEAAQERLREGADALLEKLRGAIPEARVLVLAPPPAVDPKSIRARAPALRVVHETLRDACARHRAEFVELQRVLRPRDLAGDGAIQAFGHERIARHLRRILESKPDRDFNSAAALERAGARSLAKSRFHGFDAFDFALPTNVRKAGGRPAFVRAKLVCPPVATAGRPWLWRCRFWGHEPGLDLAMLDLGWHVAYVDVAGLFGNDEALQRFDAGYDFFRSIGLAKRPVLEAMSRGGLVALRWAQRDPERVAALSLDNPVCDLRSWPGKRRGKVSRAALAAYGLKASELDDFAPPLDTLEALARAAVPIYLRLGLEDAVVPPPANGLLLEQRYRELAGPVLSWLDPKLGHHPHGLRPVDGLVRALLRAAFPGREARLRAVPSVEHRGAAAGWGKGQTWHDARAHLATQTRAASAARVVFLGDSITQSLTGHSQRISRSGGTRAIDRSFGDASALSLGLSGDRCEHLLWRIRQGDLDAVDPEFVIVQIGINDIVTAHRRGEEVAIDAREVLRALARSKPKAQILFLGCFPAGVSGDSRVRRAVRAYHRSLAGIDFRTECGPRVTYRNYSTYFLDKERRSLRHESYAPDGLHLSHHGLVTWMYVLGQTMRELGFNAKK